MSGGLGVAMRLAEAAARKLAEFRERQVERSAARARAAGEAAAASSRAAEEQARVNRG